jgi:hypothetical protein
MDISFPGTGAALIINTGKYRQMEMEERRSTDEGRSNDESK